MNNGQIFASLNEGLNLDLGFMDNIMIITSEGHSADKLV